MKTFRVIIVKFNSLKFLQKFYNLEFYFMDKLFERNIRINYKHSNKNLISLVGYDETVKYQSKKFKPYTFDKIIQFIDKMPMRPIDNKLRQVKNTLSICGLPNYIQTSHCFNDFTHQTCCLLGHKARKYSNKSGNPIGKISEQMFTRYFGRKPTKNDLTPWCTCIGSKVCSYYANKFKDGTHIKFINNKGILAYNFSTKCEPYLVKKFEFTEHLTPGVNSSSSWQNSCEHDTIII